MNDLHDRLQNESAALPGARLDVAAARRSGRRRRWAQRAGVSAVVVAGFVAGTALFLRGGEGDPAPDPVAAPPIVLDWDLAVLVEPFADVPAMVDAVLAVPGVAAAEVTDLDTVQPRLPAPEAGSAEAPSVTSETGAVVEPGPAPALPTVIAVRLDDGADPAAVGAELLAIQGAVGLLPSPEIARERLAAYLEEVTAGGTEFPGNPLIVQPAQATLGLDPAGLGEEVPLLPLESRDEFPEYWPLTADPLRDGPGQAVDRTLPLVHVGVLPGGERLILHGTADGALCVSTVDLDGGVGSGCGRLPDFPEYGVGGYSATESAAGARGLMSVVVPPETTVVVVTMGTDTFWQRPVGGHAIFPFEGTSPPVLTTVQALDAAGAELGTWEPRR